MRGREVDAVLPRARSASSHRILGQLSLFSESRPTDRFAVQQVFSRRRPPPLPAWSAGRRLPQAGFRPRNPARPRSALHEFLPNGDLLSSANSRRWIDWLDIDSTRVNRRAPKCMQGVLGSSSCALSVIRPSEPRERISRSTGSALESRRTTVGSVVTAAFLARFHGARHGGVADEAQAGQLPHRDRRGYGASRGGGSL